MPFGTRLVTALREGAGRVGRSALRDVRRLRRRVARTPAAAGNPWVEATIAFDRALVRRRWRPEVLGCRLPVLDEVAPGWRRERGLPHERVIAVEDVVGTVDSGAPEFDRRFRPVDVRARPRFIAVFAAMYRGEPVGRVEVYAWQGDYYVLDGHHRVAAARALGQDFLEAVVTEVGEHAHSGR